MAPTIYDFILSGDHGAVKAAIAGSFESLGYQVSQAPNGAMLASRGSNKKTIWLGALAGKDFAITMLVEFFQNDGGELVARVRRDATSGALKGGALGAAKANNAFADAVNTLQDRLGQAGIIQRVVTPQG
ncbi:hypothetical protein LWF01_11870 [Saxibacter everestensis]|uniref:Uncharacterized protein n=1 Tax=Saxibacter everestensis TaxID=2909229 RepID=A0ABY8QPD4_9MICO|nr:hypothetical protein LWF01_11870 [Brevibacteriaceae bacterium ZFBP1038]